MKKLFLAVLSIVGYIAFFGSVASAVPVAIGGPLSGPGDGLNSRWVNTNYAPHNVDQAIGALGLNSGDTGYVSEVNQVVSAIDFSDRNLNGWVSGYTYDPMSPDDNFAVGYSGYINITQSDTYTFRSYTDDGFRLSIGGEMTFQYYGDRAPGTSTTSLFLDAGLYDFTFIGWEQGGAFVNELTWHDSSTTTWSLVDSENLFTSYNNPVPEPGTILLFSTGLMGLIFYRRKKSNGFSA